eukprot:1030296-Heterocapsa_arctica.AAC.1
MRTNIILDRRRKLRPSGSIKIEGWTSKIRKEMGKINKNTQYADEQTQRDMSERINEEEETIDTQEYEL